MVRRVLVAWSSGKDSAWMLHRLRRDPAAEVVGLLTTLEEDSGRVGMHGVPAPLVRAQAASLDLPLAEVPLPWPCPNETYIARVKAALEAQRSTGVDTVAFGDLFLDDVRRWREDTFGAFELEFPLWGEDTAELAREMLAGGLEAVVTAVDTEALDSSLLGRAFDEALLDALPPGVDPCGENGELHTFVTNGPGFGRSVPVRPGPVHDTGRFPFVELEPA